jgi:hypothetical protein
MANDDAGPLSITDAPMEVGPLDLGAWLPPPKAISLPVTQQPQPDVDALATLAIEAWRIKGRLAKLHETLAAKELRPLEISLAKMEEALATAGVLLDDPQGRPFHEGDPLEVLLFEPSPGLARSTVLQTVKPAVRVAGKLSRRAEVVVGTPAEGAKGGPP